MELGEFYRVAGSWALLQRELGWVAAGRPQGSPATMKSGWGGGSPAACCTWMTPRGCVAGGSAAAAHGARSGGLDPVAERLWRMLMAQLWGSGRQHLPWQKRCRLWAAADLRAELVGLLALLLEAPAIWWRPSPGRFWPLANRPAVPVKLQAAIPAPKCLPPSGC